MSKPLTRVFAFFILQHPRFCFGLVLCGWVLTNFLTFISAFNRYPADHYAVEQTKEQVFESEMEKAKALYHHREDYLYRNHSDEILRPYQWEFLQKDSMRYSFDCNTPFTLSLDMLASVFPHNSDISLAFCDQYQIFADIQIHKNAEVILKRLSDIGLPSKKVYQQNIDGIPTLTIQKFLSPELTPKLLSNKKDIVFLRTKDRNEIPQRIREKIMNYIEYPSPTPHLLGYVNNSKYKKEIDRIVYHELNSLPKDAYLMWSFAKEKTNVKDENGNDIFAYGLYYLGDNPNPNKTGLNLHPIQKVFVDYEYDTPLSSSNLPLQVKLFIDKGLSSEWNFFTLKEKKKYCAIVMDNEVLYTHYIPIATENLVVEVTENHRLRDLPYIYAILRNDPFQEGPQMYYNEVNLVYHPFDTQETKHYFILFIVPFTILIIYSYLNLHLKRKKAAYKRQQQQQETTTRI